MSVLAIAAGAAGAGWAMASFGPEVDVPGARRFLGREKALLDAGETPRFATLREMEKGCSAFLGTELSEEAR